VRFASFADPTKFINHFSQRARMNKLGEPAEDFEFVIREGLADPKAVSIESKNHPNWYLINRNGNVWLAQYDATDDFKAAASWWQKPGLASADDLSFESFSKADAYLITVNGFLNVKAPATDEEKAASTFIMSNVTD